MSVADFPPPPSGPDLTAHAAARRAEVLRRAAQVVRENGLTKGSYWSPELNRPNRKCPVCAVGALAVAFHGDPVPPMYGESDAFEDLLDLLADEVDPLATGDPVAAISLWNDTDDRTAEQVAACFEAAADAVEAGER